MKMNPYLRYFSFALAMVLLGVANSSSSSSSSFSATSRVMMAMRSQQRCNGSTITECVAEQGGEEEEELLMESEVSRRILAESMQFTTLKANQGKGTACNGEIYGAGGCIGSSKNTKPNCGYYTHCNHMPG